MTDQVLLLLTLEKHKNGVWITRLQTCLEQSKELLPTSCNVVVCSVEAIMSNKAVEVKTLFPKSNMVGIVNRVSDAAPTHIFKMTMALLLAAKCRGIPVWNGPQSYGMCASKWCHHIVFQQAGLSFPQTHVLFMANKTDELLSNALDTSFSDEESDILIKPNAGGFGAGITRVAPGNRQESSLPLFEDQTLLIQSFVPPRKKEIYRVWFLQGKVQCAVFRHHDSDDSAEDFTSGCAGQVCSRSSSRPPRQHAWLVPEDVRHEIENSLLPLLVDAHCGSVEFLVDENGIRQYFDINLLSTLPVNVDDASAWSQNYDPWKQLAEAVARFIVKENQFKSPRENGV